MKISISMLESSTYLSLLSDIASIFTVSNVPSGEKEEVKQSQETVQTKKGGKGDPKGIYIISTVDFNTHNVLASVEIPKNQISCNLGGAPLAFEVRTCE